MGGGRRLGGGVWLVRLGLMIWVISEGEEGSMPAGGERCCASRGRNTEVAVQKQAVSMEL